MAAAAAATTAALLLLRRRAPWRLLRIPVSVAALSQCPADRRVWPRRQHQQPASSYSSSHYNSREEMEEEVAETEGGRPTIFGLWVNDPDYRKWKDKEALILSDVEPIISLAKDILHSSRYNDGEQLSDEDKKIVVEKLLAYHPHSEDKIGCGLYSIMVDRHPEYRHSRCLFVVRTDGGWIDFSYQKCLRAYIRKKYPSEAEKFIKKHFKRT